MTDSTDDVDWYSGKFEDHFINKSIGKSKTISHKKLYKFLNELINSAPKKEGFEIGGKYDYVTDNTGDMERKAVAQYHYELANKLKKLLKECRKQT